MKSTTVYYDVLTLRATEFPFTKDVTYLNHASIAPLPQRSSKAAQEALAHMAGNATAYFGGQLLPTFLQFLEDSKTYLNAASPLEIVPVTSTSTGLNAVANALQWQDADEVVFCDVEFPSNVYPWMAQERRQEIRTVIVPAQHGTLTVEALDAAVTERTRLVAVSAIQFFTGARADLKAIGEFCHARGILFAVDAIQAIGHMVIDVEAMHIDILSSGGQKSMMSMPGSGLLYVRQAVADEMIPASIGPNATEDWEFWLKYNTKPLEGAHRFMAGTFNGAGVVTAAESMKLFAELGRENIDVYTTALSTYLIEQLTEKGYEVLTPHEAAYHGPIVTFRYADSVEETDAFVKQLSQQHIVVTRHLNAKGEPFIRLSNHCYNNEDDIDKFLHSI